LTITEAEVDFVADILAKSIHKVADDLTREGVVLA
jgi:hypothetical protein